MSVHGGRRLWKNDRRQRGDSKLGCVLWLLLLAIVGYIGYQVIPVKIKDMQLKDHMEELAQRSPRATARQFSESIHKRALELGLPVEKKNIRVEKNMRRARMQVEYVVQVNIIVTTIDWSFNHDLERDIFII